jgi:hypothetical protein
MRCAKALAMLPNDGAIAGRCDRTRNRCLLVWRQVRGGPFRGTNSTESSASASPFVQHEGDLARMLSAARDSKRSPDTGDLMVQINLVAGARLRLYRKLCWVAA